MFPLDPDMFIFVSCRPDPVFSVKLSFFTTLFLDEHPFVMKMI